MTGNLRPSLHKLPLHKIRDWVSGQLAPPPDRSSRRATVVICVTIFFVALAVRLLHWQDSGVELALKNSIMHTMGSSYEDEARRIVNEGGVLVPNAPVQQGNAWMIVHPPGYSILMAALFSLFGESEWLMRLVRVILTSAGAVIIVLIAAELFPRGVAVLSGLLAAISPHLAYYSIWHSPDSLAPLPILLAIFFLIRAWKRPRLRTLLAAGAMVGLSCWLRSNALLLAPFLGLAALMLVERGKRLKYSAAILLATVAVIAPITIRNWILYGSFIPLSLGAGITLVEGIAEYDYDNRFNLPVMDNDVQLEEARRLNRPDYRHNPFSPDGVERDRARFKRAAGIIRDNPSWFSTVLLRRMRFMLRYNDFDPQDRPFNTTIAPTVAARPNFGHRLADADGLGPVWSATPPEMIVTGELLSDEANAKLAAGGALLDIEADNTEQSDQFASQLIQVRDETDYLLRIPVRRGARRAALKVKGVDPRITLAWVGFAVPQKNKKTARAAEGDLDEQQPLSVLQVPFASGDLNEVRIVISSDGPIVDKHLAEMGEARLFELGPTPYGWTRAPRAIIRGLQKNIFRTNRMWWLIIIGVVALAVARRRSELLILLVVPVYYLLAQSFFHTEYRYILTIHYFLFVIAAATLYLAGKALWHGALLARARYLRRAR
ncbi:MAG TPA: glycosyltransferase family 39 protein [Blastocatellia bacterium]|nr:glycosyltransferase family 39 protein [Blastocatellia bacterium]